MLTCTPLSVLRVLTPLSVLRVLMCTPGSVLRVLTCTPRSVLRVWRQPVQQGPVRQGRRGGGRHLRGHRQAHGREAQGTPRGEAEAGHREVPSGATQDSAAVLRPQGACGRSVQFSSVQFKMVSMRSGRPICTPPSLLGDVWALAG